MASPSRNLTRCPVRIATAGCISTSTVQVPVLVPILFAYIVWGSTSASGTSRRAMDMLSPAQVDSPQSSGKQENRRRLRRLSSKTREHLIRWKSTTPLIKRRIHYIHIRRAICSSSESQLAEGATPSSCTSSRCEQRVVGHSLFARPWHSETRRPSQQTPDSLYMCYSV